MRRLTLISILASLLILSAGCVSDTGSVYFNPNMDFGAVQTVAVLPLLNLTNEDKAGERVRDEFMNQLLATQAVYVLPPGEVARGLSRAGVINYTSPATEEVKKLGNILKVDAVITGALREYGTVRSGNTSANVVSLSLQMIETQTGSNVWSATSTKGGITTMDRLFGGGGEPMNEVTEAVVKELIDKLFE